MIRAPSLARKILKDLIAARSIYRGKDHVLVSPSGTPQSWLLDLRPVLLSSKGLAAITDLFWDRYEHELPFQIGGMEMAAVPLVSGILLAASARGYQVEGFVVRKERKKYGRMQSIESELTDLPIVVVDDIFNSGKSLEKIRVVLDNARRSIWKVWAIIDYHSPKGAAWQARHGVDVESLFSLDDFELKKTLNGSTEPGLQFARRWMLAADGANHFFTVPKSAPRAANGRIYFGTDSGELRCVDGATGAMLWRFQVGSSNAKGIRSIPCVSSTHVYFGAYDGNVYALHADTGREAWKHVEADWVGSSPDLAAELNLVFVGVEYARPGRSGGIVALDAGTGAKVWEAGTLAYVHGSPLFVPALSLVLCGTNDGFLVALDASDGTLRWLFQTGDAIKHAPAVDLARKLVVVGGFDGAIRGIDLVTGQERFSVQTGNIVYATPLVDGGRAYCGSADKHLYVIDLDTGETIKKIKTQGKVFSSPRRFGAWIWFGANDGLVRAVDPADLSVVGELQLPDAVTGPVEYDAANQMLVVASNANVLYGVAVLPALDVGSGRSPKAGGQTRQVVRPIELARLTLDAFIAATPLPDPWAYVVPDDPVNGGVFVSLREATTQRRVAREGQWRFEPGNRSLASEIVLATAKACAGVAVDALRGLTIGLAVFGALEGVTPGRLDSRNMGVVVRPIRTGRLGGALPNSPDYANELGQYLHALHNAGLKPTDPHELYRHTVCKHSEGIDWPPYGSPSLTCEADLERVVQSICSHCGLAGADASGSSTLSDDYPAIESELLGVAVTHYVSGRVGTLFFRVNGLKEARDRVVETVRAIRQDRNEAGAAVLSLLFRGKRISEDALRSARAMRIAADALLYSSIDGERVALPALSLQRNLSVTTIVDTLRPESPDGGRWELAPCRSWLLSARGALPMDGAFVDTSTRSDGLSYAQLLPQLAANVMRRVPELSITCNTYLPVLDRYLGAPDGPEQYIELMSALKHSSLALHSDSGYWHAVSALESFVTGVVLDTAGWHELRRPIQRALLSLMQTSATPASLHASQPTEASGLLTEWVKSFVVGSADGLDLLFSLRILAADAADLRQYVSPVKAGLERSASLDIRGAEIFAECAVYLIGRGYRTLLDPLRAQASRIVSWQLSSTGAFVPAMGHWGPTADTAPLMHALTLTLSVMEADDPERAPLVAAWSRGFRVLTGLLISPADSFCLKAPERAIGALRDAKACAIASARSSASALAACAHAASIGLDLSLEQGLP
jgi:outer membrane protein assembly factor BamB/orotate phosphoribosyltransferase